MQSSNTLHRNMRNLNEWIKENQAFPGETYDRTHTRPHTCNENLTYDRLHAWGTIDLTRKDYWYDSQNLFLAL